MSERSIEQRTALAARLCELRRHLNMTPQRVQYETDGAVSMEYLERLEKALVPFPSPHILFYLSQAYNYPYPKLMELAGHFVVTRTHPIDQVEKVLRDCADTFDVLIKLRHNADGQIGWRGDPDAKVDYIRVRHILLIERTMEAVNKLLTDMK